MIDFISTFLSFSSLALSGSQLVFALLLDRTLGEPKHFHPLIGFGHLANCLAAKFNPPRSSEQARLQRKKTRFKGMLCWALLVLPLPVALWVLNSIAYAASSDSPLLLALIWLLNSVLLYLAIGLKSLQQHTLQIYQPLVQGDMACARHFTGYMVSRDTQTLTTQDMSRAAVESVLENGHDGVIASLFYFVLGGAPLVVLHRLINTLDAMWGYKTARFLYFGWWAARVDDHIGWLSTYCTSLLYVLAGPKPFSFKLLPFAWQQARQYKSQNGGRCMATGASVLDFTLGGTSRYQGNIIHSPILGRGREVALGDIPRSISLVKRSAWIFTFMLLFCALVSKAIF